MSESRRLRTHRRTFVRWFNFWAAVMSRVERFACERVYRWDTCTECGRSRFYAAEGCSDVARRIKAEQDARDAQRRGV